MLAADLVKHAQGEPDAPTVATRINLLRRLGTHLADPHAPDATGRCICGDADFRAAYEAKYSSATNQRGESTSGGHTALPD